MRIGIDARLCGSEHRGIGRYTESLLRSLLTTKHELVVVCRSNSKCLSWLKKANVKTVINDSRPYTWSEQISFLRLLYKLDCELFHFPHFNVPLLYFKPFVVTIHDLILHHHPSRQASTLFWPLYWLKYAIYRLVLFNALHRAKKVISVSEYTKEDLLDHYYLQPTKIETITEEVPSIGEKSYGETDKIWYNKYGSYALYVGAAYPHKNLNKLVDAWESIGPQASMKLVLVIPDDQFGIALKNRIEEKKLFNEPCGISILFNVSDSELEEIYMGSQVVIIPSLYEGVGLPGLEAILSGKMVISSPESVLAETYGDAVVYFDPRTVCSIKKGVTLALNNKLNKGRKPAYKILSKSNIARKLSYLYQQVAE